MPNLEVLALSCAREHAITCMYVVMMSDLVSDDPCVVILSGDEETGNDHRCGVFTTTKCETLPSEVSR